MAIFLFVSPGLYSKPRPVTRCRRIPQKVILYFCKIVCSSKMHCNILCAIGTAHIVVCLFVKSQVVYLFVYLIVLSIRSLRNDDDQWHFRYSCFRCCYDGQSLFNLSVRRLQVIHSLITARLSLNQSDNYSHRRLNAIFKGYSLYKSTHKDSYEQRYVQLIPNNYPNCWLSLMSVVIFEAVNSFGLVSMSTKKKWFRFDTMRLHKIWSLRYNKQSVRTDVSERRSRSACKPI